MHGKKTMFNTLHKILAENEFCFNEYIKMLSPALNPGDWNGLDVYTVYTAPEFQQQKKNTWKGEY
jgi:hypothetical protein